MAIPRDCTMDNFELQLAYDRRGETIGWLQEQNEAVIDQNGKLHAWNVEKEKRIHQLEAKNAALKADVLALARRLLFEPADSFAPESWEAMDRWRFEAMAVEESE